MTMTMIKQLAEQFEALGGMQADNDAAINAHCKLADAIESSSDYLLAIEIAESIVKDFDY